MASVKEATATALRIADIAPAAKKRSAVDADGAGGAVGGGPAAVFVVDGAAAETGTWLGGGGGGRGEGDTGSAAATA